MSIEQQTVEGFLDSVAQKSPTPGGGAVAAVAGTLSGALAQMVLSYSVGKKSLAANEPELQAARASLGRARGVMLELAAEDEAAYAVLNDLMKLPADDPRSKGIGDAALTATQVPLALMATGCDLLRLFVRLAAITNRQLRSDLAIAAVLAEATVRASHWNVRINLELLERHAVAGDTAAQAEKLSRTARDLAAQVEAAC